MGYKNPEMQRFYQREWMRSRRERYFIGKSCATCGSKVNLELDHKNPKDKADHKIWSWSKVRRDIELAKCEVLCSACHRAKTNFENDW